MQPFALSGKIVARPGQRDELVEVLLRAADQLGTMPGCRLYIVSVVEEEPDAVLVMELWSNRDDHARSLENDNVRALIQEGRPLIADFAQQVRMTPVGGKGLD